MASRSHRRRYGLGNLCHRSGILGRLRRDTDLCTHRVRYLRYFGIDEPLRLGFNADWCFLSSGKIHAHDDCDRIGIKELERLLTVIGAQKDQAAFAALYSATKRKLFSTVLLIVKRADLARNYPGSLRAHLAQRELLSLVTWVTDDLDDHRCSQSGDRHGQKTGARIYPTIQSCWSYPPDGPTALEIIEASEDHKRRCRNSTMCFRFAGTSSNKTRSHHRRLHSR